jgi:hypothetical protein
MVVRNWQGLWEGLLMTRKHFIKLAEALKSVKADIKTVDAIAKVCEESNPNFDWFKFEQACRESSND